jgi:hypothetical protein
MERIQAIEVIDGDVGNRARLGKAKVYGNPAPAIRLFVL